MFPTMASFHPRTERRLAAAGRIHDLLRSAIMHGEIPSGVLPSEAELMESFSASRQVIRGALELLRREGLVRRLQGTGTLVSSIRVTHDFDFLHGPVQAVEHRLLSVSEEIAPPSVARKLALASGQTCGIVETVTFLDDAPLHSTTAYVQPSFLPHLSQFSTTDEWFALYARAGVELGTTEHTIEASVADPFSASLLEVSPGHPLLVLERLVLAVDESPVEYAFTRIRGDRLTLRQRHTRDGSPSHPIG